MERRQLYIALVVGMVVGLASIMSAGDVPDRPPEQPKAEVFSGTIRDVNIEKRVVTLETAPLIKTFGVPPDCVVMTEDNPRASLEDLLVGSVAAVTYEDVSGVLVAHRIEQKRPPSEAQKTGGVFTMARGARL